METITTAQADCKSNSTSRPDTPRARGELARPTSTRSCRGCTGGQGTLPNSDFVLSALKAATLRARLAAAEFDTVGLALKRNLVSVEGALAWLHDIDLLDHVIHRPILDAH